MDIHRAQIIQDQLKQILKVGPFSKKIGNIAGVDVAFEEDGQVFGAACLLSFPDLHVIEETWALKKSTLPYIPGYLSFREAPVLMAALKQLTIRPDLILVDGQGIAHPRGLGLASHLGVLLDIPTIGCAKSRLVGEYNDPGGKKGDWSYLKLDGELVGAVLRTKTGVRPLFISPGHRIDLPESIKVVLKATTQFRIPEPLRRADQLSRLLKTKYKGKTYLTKTI